MSKRASAEVADDRGFQVEPVVSLEEHYGDRSFQTLLVRGAGALLLRGLARPPTCFGSPRPGCGG